MATQIRNVEWKYTKTFANEKNLMKFIESHKQEIGDEYNDQVYPIRTPEGRWTAVVKLDTSIGGYLARWPFLSM